MYGIYIENVFQTLTINNKKYDIKYIFNIIINMSAEHEKKITYSTCFYQLKNKFTSDVYFKWMDNMLSQVNQYYLVIYTYKETEPFFQKYTSNTKII